MFCFVLFSKKKKIRQLKQKMKVENDHLLTFCDTLAFYKEKEKVCVRNSQTKYCVFNHFVTICVKFSTHKKGKKRKENMPPLFKCFPLSLFVNFGKKWGRTLSCLSDKISGKY